MEKQLFYKEGDDIIMWTGVVVVWAIVIIIGLAMHHVACTHK